MTMESIGPWAILAAYAAVTWWVTPRRVSAPQFFDGRTDRGAHAGILLVAFSAARTWIVAMSVAKAADLS
jgi:hypothetical protein